MDSRFKRNFAFTESHPQMADKKHRINYTQLHLQTIPLPKAKLNATADGEAGDAGMSATTDYGVSGSTFGLHWTNSSADGVARLTK